MGRLVAIATLLILTLLTGCGDGSSSSDGEPKDGSAFDAPPAAQPPRVVCGNAIIEHFAERIAAGSQVTAIDTLARREESPGDYLPRPLDVELMKAADVIFLNGLGLEAVVAPMIERLSNDVTVVRLGPAARQSLTVAGGAAEAAEQLEPQRWLNVAEARAYVRIIADTLAEQWPADAATFRANADALLRELDELNAWILQQTEPLTAAQRIVLTNQPALCVLGNAYGLDVRLIELDTSRYPTVADQQRLGELLATHKPRAVYLDDGGDAIWAELIADAVAERQARLIDVLYFDTLSAPSGPASTFDAMMRHDVNAIVAATQPVR